MKKTFLATTIAFTAAFSVQAVTFNQPDQDYIAAAESIGMTGENWDAPEYVSASMPHVYKFSHSYTLHKGDYVLDLKKSDKQLDLDKVMIQDYDGPISATHFLMNRFQNHNAVILQDGKIVHEHYSNGLNELSPPLSLSFSPSFPSLSSSLSFFPFPLPPFFFLSSPLL